MQTEIIHEVADFIEAHPECYDFWKASKPRSENYAACPLAWVQYFCDLSDDDSLSDAARHIGFNNSSDFYATMNRLQDEHFDVITVKTQWQDNLERAVFLLRKMTES